MSEGTPRSGMGRAVFRGTVQDDHGHRLPAMVRVFQGESPRLNRHVEGNFAFDLPPGSYRFEVTAEGYPPQQYKITLAPKGGAAHTFVMRTRLGGPEGDNPPGSGPAPSGQEDPDTGKPTQ